MSKPTPHEILEISLTSIPAETKAAYHRLILIHHPDKSPEDQREAATNKFREIRHAYEVLTDPEKAAEHAAEKRRERKDEERAEKVRAEAAKAQAGGEQRRDDEEEVEESTREREETERNTRGNQNIGREKEREQPKGRERSSRPAAPREAAKEGNERTVTDSARTRGCGRHQEAEGEDNAQRDGGSGKKGVRFERGSTPPLRRRRETSPSPERQDWKRRRSPFHRRSRDVPEYPRTPGFSDPKRTSRPDAIHLFYVERDHHARVNGRHGGIRRTPSRHSLKPTDLAPLLDRPRTVRRAQSVYDLKHSSAPPSPRPKRPSNNTAPAKTLTSTALSSAVLVTTHLTALSHFLTRDLRLSATSTRPTLITHIHTSVTHLTTHLHTLQSHPAASPPLTPPITANTPPQRSVTSSAPSQRSRR